MAEPATGGETLPRFAVILGSPRSGTTWLQRVLAAHPNVATPQETHLFALYLAPLYARWDRQKRVSERNLQAIETGQADAGRLLGLATILDDEDVDFAGRSLLDSVVRRTVEAVADERDDVRVVIEKTPSNAEHTDLIERIAPTTRYIHVIRDPRDVAASLIAASGDWGGRWAPRTADSAARMWLEHLEGARKVSRHADRYLEVRYEDMRADLSGQLTRILEFLDLPADAGGTAAELAKRQGEFAYKPAMRKRMGAVTVEPAAFSGEGKVRHGLSSSQQLIVEHRTAALREELGYGATERWPARPSVQKAAVVPVAGAVSASRQAVRRGLLRAVGNRSVAGMVPED